MKNKVLEKLNKGERVLGTFMEFEDANTVECFGLAGLDFFIIDTEHGAYDVSHAVNMVRAAQLRGITPFARVKDPSRISILKMLDIGVQGLIIPGVRSIEEVKALISYGKYFPEGTRGVALGREGGWGYAPGVDGHPVTDYMAEQNRETMLIPQCETLGCLEDIENIAALPGVSGIFLGPIDLSTELGRPWDYTNPEFLAAVDRIIAACKAAGKPLFVYCGDNETAKLRFRQGFDAVALGTDAAVLISAMRRMKADVLQAE